MNNEYASKFFHETVMHNLPDCHGAFLITASAGIDTVKHPIGVQYNTNMNPRALRAVLSCILVTIDNQIKDAEK